MVKKRRPMKRGQAYLGEDVYSVIMDEKIHNIFLRSMPEGEPLTRDREADEIAKKVVKWIESGEEFSYPFTVAGTPFQQKVYHTIQRIPKGRVTTYGVVAASVGTKAYRAVGQALHANPVPLLIPCHRVIGSDRKLTGFGGGVDLKRKILEAEGVEFEGEKVKKEYILEKI
jgi:methylated-DNA-[protein]-cysteine S-methyltransferase